MRVLITYFLGFAIVLLLSGGAIASPTSKVTVKVVDENSQPMRTAEVEVWYHVGNKQTTNKGVSSDKGEFVSTGEGLLPQVTIYARYQGYYESCVIHKFDIKSLFNRWEPWNPTIEVVLKKKRNPVPMFIGGGIIKVPKLDKSVGYDLEKGDWVAPYGNGNSNDLIFTFSAQMRAFSDYECGFELSFSNAKDGIMEYSFDTKNQSLFKWPYEAPENGYAAKLSRHEVKLPGKNLKSDAKKGINYLFRVRTQTDQNGNITGANYGKLVGEFGFDPMGDIQFHYFFNPDGTRNLEEDPEKNLFKKY